MQTASFAGARGRFLSPATMDLLIVIGSAWVVRAVVIAAWPASAHSADLNSWMEVAQQLRVHANPYATTDILKWPPFALVLVWWIDHVAIHLGVSFFTVMQATLVAAEGAVAAALYFLMTRFVPGREVRRILLVGICFNPIAILFPSSTRTSTSSSACSSCSHCWPSFPLTGRGMPWGGSPERSPSGSACSSRPSRSR